MWQKNRPWIPVTFLSSPCTMMFKMWSKSKLRAIIIDTRWQQRSLESKVAKKLFMTWQLNEAIKKCKKTGRHFGVLRDVSIKLKADILWSDKPVWLKYDSSSSCSVPGPLVTLLSQQWLISEDLDQQQQWLRHDRTWMWDRNEGLVLSQAHS